MDARLQNRTRVWAGFVTLIGASALWAQTTNQVIGTWQLNLSKSSFNPGPPPKSQTRTYEDYGGGVILHTYVGFDAQGKPTFAQYAVKCDGKDYPYLVKGAESVYSVACKEIDAYTTEYYEKEEGKPTLTATRVISKDGKVSTVTSTGRRLNGEVVRTIRVFDKKR